MLVTWISSGLRMEINTMYAVCSGSSVLGVSSAISESAGLTYIEIDDELAQDLRINASSYFVDGTSISKLEVAPIAKITSNLTATQIARTLAQAVYETDGIRFCLTNECGEALRLGATYLALNASATSAPAVGVDAEGNIVVVELTRAQYMELHEASMLSLRSLA